MFARVYDPVTGLFEGRMEPHRRYLSRDLSGSVLDVGAGTGANFSYLKISGAEEVHAVEPDPHMRRQAEEEAEDLGFDVTLHGDVAEEMSFDDGSFDYVICGLVLCTVEDVDGSIGEMARVLKEGGELRFLEHVGSSGVTRRVQEAVNPVWRKLAGGCNLDRDTLERFGDCQKLGEIEVERFDGLPPVDPLVRGRFRKS